MSNRLYPSLISTANHLFNYRDQSDILSHDTHCRTYIVRPTMCSCLHIILDSSAGIHTGFFHRTRQKLMITSHFLRIFILCYCNNQFCRWRHELLHTLVLVNFNCSLFVMNSSELQQVLTLLLNLSRLFFGGGGKLKFRGGGKPQVPPPV